MNDIYRQVYSSDTEFPMDMDLFDKTNSKIGYENLYNYICKQKKNGKYTALLT